MLGRYTEQGKSQSSCETSSFYKTTLHEGPVAITEFVFSVCTGGAYSLFSCLLWQQTQSLQRPNVIKIRKENVYA